MYAATRDASKDVTKEIRVKTLVQSDQVKWHLVESILQSRFELSQQYASNIVENFRASLNKPFLVGWFLKPQLGSDEGKVVAAMCEAHGADQITICFDRDLRTGITLRYHHQIDFTFGKPSYAGSTAHLARPVVTLGILGKKFKLANLAQLLLAQSLLFFLGVISFVLVGLCVLYSVSVFLLFIVDPTVMTIAATRNLSVGIALVCMLALCARAFFNIGTIWRNRRR